MSVQENRYQPVLQRHFFVSPDIQKGVCNLLYGHNNMVKRLVFLSKNSPDSSISKKIIDLKQGNLKLCIYWKEEK